MLCATRPNDYEHETIYDEANIGSRSACVDLTTAPGRPLAEDLLTGADVVVNNHRGGKLEKIGLDPVQPARSHPGMVSVSVPVTGMINDSITGYMGALGAPPPCTSGRPRAAAGTSPSTSSALPCGARASAWSTPPPSPTATTSTPCANPTPTTPPPAR
ncbi:CoA transferase [Streptomyces sp. NPDC001817]|uniref:CoA transferase n=1 Tax=Streptomyces sp. NPDC001817 TaxID=3154398 RepID=UPI0033178409